MAIADELTVHDLVLRYKVDEIDDGFSGEEGSFTICSFWLVSALCEIGEFERARRLCAKLLSFAGPLQLYAEEIDPHTGQHLGNFPQAFTHLALINAVLHVIRIEEEHQLFLTAEPAALNAGEVLGRDGDDGAGESGEAAVHTTTAHPDDVDDVTRPVAP